LDKIDEQVIKLLGEQGGAYTWPSEAERGGVAASFAVLEMRCVIKPVLEEVEVRSAENGALEAMRSSVWFALESGAMVIATKRAVAFLSRA
jgi:hypothetical protein